MKNSRFIPAYLLTAVCALVASAAVAGSARAAPAATCTPGVHTVDGKPARVFCGPAKATVRIGGKTLAFAGGLCEKSGGGYVVNLGTFFAGSPTSKRPYFGLFVERAKAGTYTRQALSFRINGVSRSALATVTLKSLRGGTFSGDLIGGGRVTGSFTC